MQEKLFIKVLIFLLLSHPMQLVTAQASQPLAHEALAEKIYLQTDNEVYTNNKTVWFKVVVANALTHKRDVTSGIVYIDLINSGNRIIESKLIKIKDGIGSGYFDLNRSYDQGTYMIRAYTEWNKNFGEDFIFKKYIQIYSEQINADIQLPIKNIRIVDSTKNKATIRADFYPQLIDSSHEDVLTVTVRENSNVVDTVYIKAKEKRGYSLEFEVSTQSKYIDLGMRSSNGQTFKTSFSTQPNSIDLQFFPEGGQLVTGLSSTVGYKAITTNGLGVPIEGVVLNEQNDTITTFKSNVLGMGSFKVKPEDLESRFKAKYKLSRGQDYREVNLPNIAKNGYVLSVAERHETIIVGVASRSYPANEISVIGACRGFEFFKQKAKLVNGLYIFVIPKSTFPEGVVMFTLLDENDRPISERLFFNEREDTRINLGLSLDKSVFEKREAITLNIQAYSNNKKPIVANVSVLTVDSGLSGDNYLTRKNILSHFLLSSDLRGTVEEPGLYFSSKNRLNIDDLMLTQGWRQYKYDDISKKLNYKLEKGIQISGVVNTKNRKNKERELDLMLMTLDKARAIYSTRISVPGIFRFNLEDIYGQYMDVAIQSLENSKQDQKELIIAVNKRKQLPPNFEYKSRSITIDSLSKDIINKNRNQKSDLEMYQFNTYGTTVLDEVVLTGYNMTPKRQEVFDRYGPPDIVIKGDDIRAKEKKWSWGLFNVLLEAFPDKIKVEADDRGNLMARVLGETTLFLVDGKPVTPIYYDKLQYISVEEVTSFEILETSKNFVNLFLRINGPSPNPPNFGGIISIYTKRGVGLLGALDVSEESFKRHRIQVFATEKEFYVPEYDVTNYYEDSRPDLRLPIYWKPKVVTDDYGKAVVLYHHSDDTGEFQIIVEGMSQEGHFGYQTIDYSVISNTD
jgi:hypothetical protein